MQVRKRWAVVPVAESDIEEGDLLFVTEGPRQLLAFVTAGVGGRGAVVLREFGPPSPFPPPIYASWEGLRADGYQKLIGDFTLDPPQQTAEGVLAVAEPGAKCFLGAFDDAVTLMLPIPNAGLVAFDLGTGHRITGKPSLFRQSGWRLMWHDGDDAIALFMFA